MPLLQSNFSFPLSLCDSSPFISEPIIHTRHPTTSCVIRKVLFLLSRQVLRIACHASAVVLIDTSSHYACPVFFDSCACHHPIVVFSLLFRVTACVSFFRPVNFYLFRMVRDSVIVYSVIRLFFVLFVRLPISY